MSSNVIVTKTVNKVEFEVDKQSFSNASKQIKKLRKEWEGVGQRGGKTPAAVKKNDPAEQFLSSSRKVALVNKRLAETRKREETKLTNHRIALAKREARSTAAVQMQSAARIKQKMSQMTGRSRESSDMRKYYQNMERSSKRDPNANWVSPAKAAYIAKMRAAQAAQLAGRTAGPAGPKANSGFAGREADLARAAAATAAGQRQAQREAERQARLAAAPRPVPKAGPNTGPQRQSQGPSAGAGRNINPGANAAAKAAARAENTISTNSIRLSSKYGSGYSSSLGNGAGTGGISKLNAELRAGRLSISQYQAHLGSLERQFRSNQTAALSFGGALKDIRSSLIGVGAAYGVFNAGSSILKHGQFFQGLDAQMALISDSPEEGKSRQKFVKDQAYRLGLDLPIASQGYTQMSVSGKGQITGDQTNELFKGYSEYATALQVDPVKYQRGITAIGQMLGKGQIMAEELKSQLAEGIPGSLQVFVKAAQEAFGDTTIDVEKLMDMMQKGQLSAAKVLPFVAKYYAEAARQGGALQKALEGNGVAMRRLSQTWINFQNEIFMGGFGEQMTKIFNDLAKVLDGNAPLARNLGRFFGNIIEGAWDMVTYVHDTFVLFSSILDHFAEEIGIKGEYIGKAFDFGSYFLGVLAFTTVVVKLFGWLSKIAGLAGALGLVKKILSGGDDSMGPPDSNGRGRGGRGGGGLGLLGKANIIAGSIATGIGLGDVVFDAAAESSDNRYGTDTTAGGNLKSNSWLGQAYDYIAGQKQIQDQKQLDYLIANGMDPVNSQSTNPFPAPLTANQAPKGEVTVKIDAGELAKYMKVIVDEQNGINFNLLAGGGN